MKFFYIYVLQSIKGVREKNGRFYTGWYTGVTNNLRKRFNEHQLGLSTYTKGRGPFELIYYEACRNRLDAETREKYLKTGMGRRYLKNRLKRFLSLTL
jgi:putative endonuclease